MPTCRPFVTAAHGEAANVLPPLRILTTNPENVLDCDVPASATTTSRVTFRGTSYEKGFVVALSFYFFGSGTTCPVRASARKEQWSSIDSFYLERGRMELQKFWLHRKAVYGEKCWEQSCKHLILNFSVEKQEAWRSGAVTRRNFTILLNRVKRVNPIVQSIVKKKQKVLTCCGYSWLEGSIFSFECWKLIFWRRGWNNTI